MLSALVAVAWRALKCCDRRSETSPVAVPVADFAIGRFGRHYVRLCSALVSIVGAPFGYDEGIGTIPFALGICSARVDCVGCFRVIAAQTRTARIVELWIESSRQFDKSTGSYAFHSPRRESAPIVLVVRNRECWSLNLRLGAHPEELRIALKHEFAHIRSYDNLKKLIFRFAPFPGMAKLEGAWSQASELAADDAAASNLNEAVDLATALVKLSRLLPVDAVPACTTGFVSGSLSLRVTRLLAWNPSSATQGPTSARAA